MRKLIIACVILLLALSLHAASIANIYYANTAQGLGNGTSCANAYAWSDASHGLNTNNGMWGTGASQIGPDTVVHLCSDKGIIEAPANSLAIYARAGGSGTAGHPITIKWENNNSTPTIVSAPYGSTVNGLVNTGGQSYITFDLGSSGVLQFDNNGTSATYGGIYGNSIAANGLVISNSHDIEIKGSGSATIRNIYVRTSNADPGPTADSANAIYGNSVGANISIHGITFVNATDSVNLLAGSSSGSWLVYANSATLTDHPINFGTNTNDIHDFSIYANDFSQRTNWDSAPANNWYHGDAIHIYSNSTGQIYNGFIYNNNFHGDWGANITGGLYCEGTRHDLQIIGNVFNTTNAVGWPSGGGAINCFGTNVVLANDTFIGPSSSSGYAINISAPSAFTGLVIQNNLCDKVLVCVNNGNSALVSSVSSWTNNRYGLNIGANPFVWNGVNKATLANFQAACPSCDTAGSSVATVSVDSSGFPTAQMAGVDLTSSAYTGWTPDGRGTTRAPTVTQGAYQYATITLSLSSDHPLIRNPIAGAAENPTLTCTANLSTDLTLKRGSTTLSTGTGTSLAYADTGAPLNVASNTYTCSSPGATDATVTVSNQGSVCAGRCP